MSPSQKIRAYAVPNLFSGIIFGTEGHIAEGTSEKAIPNRITSTSAINQLSRNGKENVK